MPVKSKPKSSAPPPPMMQFYSPADHTRNELHATVAPLFHPGRLLITRGADAVMEVTQQRPLWYLTRHLSGDWGDLDDSDKRLNDQSVKNGSRILSAYKLPNGEAIWVITEATDDNGVREATTILLPEEY